MLEVRNHTPLTATLIPGMDKNGSDYAVVVMKGKFKIIPGQKRLIFSDEPVEIFQQDKYYGEPDKTSVRYESDAVLFKKSTDIVVNGHVYAPNNRMTYSVDASVQAGNQTKLCRIFGDRLWEKSSKSVMTLIPGQPQPFDRMPMLYELAFGGVDATCDDEKTPEFSEYNPIGKGFIGTKNSLKEGFPLPNIEDPRSMIQKWDDRPIPAGFGYIGRSWKPRVSYAGTYDDQWKKTRMPLLPTNFDERYFNGAHPDLIPDKYLNNGEQITLTNLSEAGNMTFDLPIWNEPVTAFLKGSKIIYQPVLDTVVIEPDTNSVLITWRVTIPCNRQFLYLDTVIIGKKRQS